MTNLQVDHPGGDLRRNFQQAFGRVASPVGVVGVVDEIGGLHGMTATAISSLSDAPPSLVVMLNQENQTFRAIRQRGSFSVSYLTAGSEDLAYRLSRPGQSKLIDPADLDQPPGWPMPALKAAASTMICTLDDCVLQFTHGILIGRITHVRTSSGPADPLLYIQSRFERLTA